MGFMFGNKEVGQQIFDGWLQDFGSIDENSALRITLIRGINRNKPLAYRVVIAGNIPSNFGSSKILTMLSRMMTMEPEKSGNMENFLRIFQNFQKFQLIPAYLKNGVSEPDSARAIEMTEIHVRDAWEIGRNDIDSMGIEPNDDIIIPDGIKDSPVADLLEHKRRIHSI